MDNNTLMDRIEELDQVIEFRSHLIDKAIKEKDFNKMERLMIKQIEDRSTKKINEELLHSMGMHH